MTTTSKVIFGSGVIGMVARHLLGDDWTLIPFGRSRFYSFMPALDDNFIIRDDKIDHVIEHLGGKPTYVYKIAYSIQGELMPYDSDICDDWLNKTFINNPPGHANAYMKSRQSFFIYDLKVNKLYSDLQDKYKAEIVEQAGLGKVTEVGNHYFIRDGVKHDFEQCISTIPLDGLLGLCNVNGMQLDKGPLWIYHIETEDLDFEGHNQLLVVDPIMDFFKVSRIRPNRYVFYCNKEIMQPGPYFMAFMKRFDIIDGTVIGDALIRGNRQRLDLIQKLGITCIGSYAEWDWCRDVGSCIISILQYTAAVKK